MGKGGKKVLFEGTDLSGLAASGTISASQAALAAANRGATAGSGPIGRAAAAEGAPGANTTTATHEFGQDGNSCHTLPGTINNLAAAPSSSAPDQKPTAAQDNSWPTTYGRTPANPAQSGIYFSRAAPAAAFGAAPATITGITTASAAAAAPFNPPWADKTAAIDLSTAATTAPSGFSGPSARMNEFPEHHHAYPRRQGLNFQPPVPDTTNGPIQHLYIPRHDNTPGGAPIHPVSLPAGQTVIIGHGPQQQHPYQPYQHHQHPPLQHPHYFGHQQAQPVIMQGQPVIMQGQPVIMQGQPTYLPPGQTFVSCTGAGGQPAPQGYLMAGQQPQFGNVGIPGPAPVFYPGGPAGHAAAGPPDISGLGRTGLETQYQQARFATENGLFAPQDFKPADDDPARFYYVREVDGNWTQRSRFTIDNLGDTRWYLADEGYFYAVRLPN